MHFSARVISQEDCPLRMLRLCSEEMKNYKCGAVVINNVVTFCVPALDGPSIKTLSFSVLNTEHIQQRGHMGKEQSRREFGV